MKSFTPLVSYLFHFHALLLVMKYKRSCFQVHQTCQMGLSSLIDVIVLLLCFICASLATPVTVKDLSKPLWAQQIDRSQQSALNIDNEKLGFFAQRTTPKCFPGNLPQCVTTPFYYFECCADDCCMRLQPVTFVVFVAIILSILICIVIGFIRKCRASPKYKYHYAVKN
ncbi:hypothetical protein PRIPAC_82190 [Pristionchus pacificus]|uniref:Uncharacterized protein n=1 Tax=Pristionchus pacificus TaxID=54126 RepID=A0A2A6BHQ1_PRIPA|nr:hypothetical protein PRIPAC_82190 [Pristionchus pacificus]|eukprot:PDM65445.1 hypothetical protein PRIPAC_52387 [Pristionchus pacificus]